ncbi:MAG: DUF1080 domain-containing protein [Marinilabiliaceae bacterium]|nr:DUF1080 domain-containing protein [Marinilabiliaceae bacterium]
MKKILSIYIILSLFLTMGIQAQDQRTLETKVADVLALMPADDLDHLDKIMENVISYGSPFISRLTDMIIPPGTGDDTAVRFVLNSLARYTSGLQSDEFRSLVETEFIKALDKKSDKEVKAFFIRQLNLVGKQASIEKAKTYLTDNKLCEPATQLLLTIGTTEAETVLYDALSTARDENRITIIKALGELKSNQAHATILALEGSNDVNLQKVVLAALASIGNPESYSTLLNAAKKVHFKYEATNAAATFINYAQQLGENGHLKTCKKACLELMELNSNSDLLHNNASALNIYARYFDDKATALLIKAVSNDDKAYRTAILTTAREIGDSRTTKKWMSKAKSSNPAVQEDIIVMLGQRGDNAALPYLQTSLSSSSANVRNASLTALASLQKREAVPQIIKHMIAGNDIEHAKAILLYLVDKETLAPIAEALDQTSGVAKAALIDVIAAKSGQQYFDQILAYTSDADDQVQTAAISALKRTASAKNPDQLIQLLLKVDDKHIISVQEAVYAAVTDDKDADKGIRKVLIALDNTQKKERLIPVLPQLGGQVALNKVSEIFVHSDGIVREVAFNALTQWKDHSASATLFEICKKNSPEYRSKAYKGFVSQISNSTLNADQKLLQLRKIMTLAENDQEKELVISSLENVKTYLSLIYLSQFLDQKDLQQAACRSIMKVALPAQGKKVGFYGEEVHQILERTAQIIAGPESNYYKINIRKYMDAMPQEKGFVSLFNGQDLSGWKGLVGNPLTRAKMDAKTLAKKQKEANKNMLNNWSVKDGTIAFSGKGANLCSVKDYGDFEMLVDWRITKNGDSGIYLRGTPQVQVWDTSRVEVGAQVGSGGLYNNQTNISKPLKVADNPVGEWNTFHITMIGDKVTVYLNGELVVDNVTLENYWDRSLPIFPREAIELQAHGTDLAFRDVYVREISEKDYGLTENEKADGFTALFNGKNLNGWTGNKTDYLVEDGEIVIRPEKGGHGNLFTEKEYRDFNYRFEFKLTPGANNGLGIRAPLEGDAAYVGMELQILDNTAPIYENLEEYQYHGSVYGVIPAKRGHLKPVGQWNTEEVIVKGSTIKIILNGVTIVDGDIIEASKNGTLDHKQHPGLQREKGHIGFLGHGSVVWFRNIRIKEL